MTELTRPERDAIQLARWLRNNCRQCPDCGAFVCGELEIHVAWHVKVNNAWKDLVDAATTKIVEHDGLFQQVSAKFATQDGLFQQVSNKLTQHDANFTTAQNLINALTTRVAALEARLPAAKAAKDPADTSWVQTGKES